MSLPRFAVRRPTATVMFFLAVCIFGLFAWIKLPVDLHPNASAGSLTVYIGVRGGLPPEDIETLVTKIVEEAVANVQHLRTMLSTSRKDKSEVRLFFEPGTNLSFASLEVQERLAKIKNKLPKDIEKPIVAYYSENDYPIVILALTSDKYTPERIRELVDNSLKPKFMQVNGVANVQVAGGQERKILVEFNQTRLEAYQLSIRQVIDNIGKNNLNLLTGKRESNEVEYFIRAMGQYKTLDDLKNLVVMRTANGSSILLRDIADVEDRYIEAQSHARLNKKPTVQIYIQKANDANTISTSKRLQEVAQHLKETVLGSDIHLEVVTDRSVFIEDAMQNITTSLTVGMVLILIVIFAFLKEWRHTAIVFLSAPIAVLVTFGFMWMTGLTLNTMTLSALALGIGIVVDNATVVLENILERKRRALRLKTGESVEESTVHATEELFISLVGGTLTTVVVFLPIIFINKQVKILYSGLAFTMAFSMAASLAVAVTLVPLLASRIPLPSHQGYFPPEVESRWRAWVAGWWSGSKGAGWWGKTKAVFGRFFPESELPADTLWAWETRPVRGQWALAAVFVVLGGLVAWNAWKTGMPRGYVFGLLLLAPALLWPVVLRAWRWDAVPAAREFWRRPRLTFVRWCAASIRHQKAIFIAVTTAAVMSVAVYVFVMDKDFLGSTEQNEFVIFVELPAGAKLEISDEVVREVEKVLSETDEIKETVKTAAARVEGWSSKVYVTLRPRAERSRSVQEIIDGLRPKVTQLGQQYDSFIYFSEPESSKEFLIDVFGPDYAKLRDMATAIAEKLQGVRGLADVKLRYKPGQPELQIRVDKERAALFNLTAKDIAEDLHARLRGLRPTFFYQENYEIEIIARDQEKFRKDVEDVHNLTLSGPDGTNISIEQLAEFEFGLTPSEVWRKDKQRVIQVSANREKMALSTAADKAMSQISDLEIPEGYYFSIGGDFSDMVQNEREFRFAFFIMAGLVFIVLASLLESYTQAVMIMFTIPMALVGSIPLLWLTRTPATMSVYIGVIMLGGIALTAAIILVERINQARAEGRPLKRAVLEASLLRLSPIMNTSLTTIVDLIPLALSRSESAALWSPLALTVIGGTTMSTFLTLFMIPGMYYHIEAFKAARAAQAPVPAGALPLQTP